MCVGGGGGGGGGGDGPVFVSLFVFWIPRRATRLFVNGFRYFYFIHFVQLFCHYLIKHTYISQKFLKNLNDFRLQVIYVTNVQNGNCKEAHIKSVGL